MSTFGYTTIGTGTPDNPGNSVLFMKATSTPAGSGTLTLTTISIHCIIRFGTPQVNCAIYSDSAGVPGTLLASGTAQTVGASYGWIDVPISYVLTAGVQYWLACIVPGGGGTADVFVKLDDQGATIEFYFKANGGPPGGSSFPANGSGSTSVTNQRCSVYGTFTDSGGPSDAQILPAIQRQLGDSMIGRVDA